MSSQIDWNPSPRVKATAQKVYLLRQTIDASTEKPTTWPEISKLFNITLVYAHMLYNWYKENKINA